MVRRVGLRFGWVLAVLLCCLVLAVPEALADEVSEGTKLLEEILRCVHEQHVQQPPVDKLVQGAIQGMLETLEDPYTEYFSPEEAARFTEALENSYVGVGIRLESGDRYPVVGEVFPDSPAQKAGIRQGDVIVQVDGQDVAGMALGDVVTRIRGPEGTGVGLTIRRDGSRFTLQLKRARVAIPSVETRLMEGDVAYVRLENFATSAADEMRRVLGDWERRGVTALVLDLRDNPGGLLDAAVSVAAEILGPGRVVTRVVGPNGERETYRTGDGRERFGKIIVLVNGGTASAAEILAGALQDHGRALVLGAPTVGKGTVQRLVSLEGGGMLKLTVARYYTPKGRSLDHQGLKPDRPVYLRSLQLPLAAELARGHDQPGLVLEGDRAVLGTETITKIPAPFYQGENLYVPVRLVGEALGFEVNWNEGRIIIRQNGAELELVPDSGAATLNKQPRELTAPVLVREGVGFVPATLWQLLGVECRVAGDRVSFAAGRKSSGTVE